MKTGRLFILLLLSCLAGSALAQTGTLRNYSVREGLPSGIVYDCLQDADGFIWLATEAGLAKFDGLNFTVFTKEDGLSNNVILRIALDADGSLWIFPYGTSPCIYDFKTKKILNENNYPELKKITAEMLSVYLYQTPIGLFALSTDKLLQLENKQINILKKDIYIRNFCVIKDSFFTVRNSDNKKVMIDRWTRNKSVWENSATTQLPFVPQELIVKSSGKLEVELNWNDRKIFCPTANTLDIYKINDARSFNITRQHSLQTDGELLSVSYQYNKVYVCTERGVLVLDSLGHFQQKILDGIAISRLLIDRSGNTWYCSLKGKGVFLHLNNNIRNITPANGLPEENITGLKALPSGELITGDISGNLNRIGLTPGRIIVTPLHRFMTTVKEVNISGNLSYGNTERELFQYSPSQPLTYTCVENSLKTTFLYNDHFYVGQYSGVTMFDSHYRPVAEYTFRKRGSTLVVSGDKIYWGNNTGLYMTDTANFSASPDKIVKLPVNEPVTTLYQTADGIIWAGTSTKGIFVLDHEHAIVNISLQKRMGQKGGDICKKIYAEPNSSRVWVATNRGIYAVNYSKDQNSFHYESKLISSENGLADNDVNDIDIHNGTVYAATVKGISIFPSDLPPQHIPLFITGFRINTRDGAHIAVQEQASHHLKYNENNITISFAGICFSCDNKLEYEYRLIGGGTDSVWTTTNSNSVEFGQLGPGNYAFQVRTGYSELKEVQFSIEPAFWQTRWFVVLTLLLFLLISYLAINAYTQRERKKNREQIRLNRKFAELELNALQSQMNPHFIFNTMNTLQGYILSNETLLANEYLSKYSQLMRLFLDASRSKFVTLANEIQLLHLYIELENLRQSKAFTWTIETDPQLDKEARIPSVIIQPFVENAIVHGLRHLKAGQGRLSISFKAVPGGLVCSIDDNGIGREEARAIGERKQVLYRSYGTSLITEKIEALKSMQHIDIKIDIADKKTADGKAAGTLVTIRFRF